MSNQGTFKKSTIHGDAVLGNKNVYEAALLPLEAAIKAILTTTEGNPELEGIIEELAEFITDRPDREVIGVEAKLEKGGRHDLVKDAVYLKNKFERTITKKQLSLIDQKVYSHVLAMISSTFNQKVRPLILEGQPNSVIDSAIKEEIIDPVYQSIVSFSHQVTADLVAGMLYFLTGKCHLLWSEE